MASNIFDDLQSPVSYDADFDRGWRLISEKGDNAIKSIFDLLQRVYWDAVKDEMANVILAFDDYKTYVPEGLPELGDGALESDYLRELLDLWDPLGLPDDIKDNVARSVLEEVKERQKVPQDELIARALLQACGFSDYDYIQEYRKPTFPSLGPGPQVDKRYPGIYEAVQCSECRFCIRSFHYYECNKGCKDSIIHRNHTKTAADKSAMREGMGHVYIDLLWPVPYRLCCNCMEASPHPRDHLKIAYRFKKAGDEDIHVFSRELDVLEDHIKGQSMLSFGNAFLDHISFGGARRSLNPRRLFPAGNAHCALMFGPLLIENGMTIHPGGALISTRALPTLGHHSPREVSEYLHPENYKTVQGCDIFCAQVYSVSPDRRVYEATKRAKERRFLCSRKQLSGGLFTDYNYSRPAWKSAEDNIVQLFLQIAAIWCHGKSPVAPESENRELLQECAAQLARSMEVFFSDEITLHLFLLAQKLGKTQKLKYSRMSNNCQDFCNGLLNYDSYSYPTFSTMYPFIPVSLSPDIDKKADDRSLSYLQSFVKPLQYPIPGSSKRAMIGSAVTMYSSYAQNDADLIDHVYSVRFGRDSEDGFSLGFGDWSPAEDVYLLKDEEMSCSDRFAAAHRPDPTGKGHACSLADHLLDCPVDNLSVLSTHLHRQKKYYTHRDINSVKNQDFYVNLPPSAWITNRLQVLRRLKLLHDFLADIAAHLQECCRMGLPSFEVTDMKTLRKVWRPVNTLFSRAWHMDKRDGNTLHYAPDIDFGTGEMDNYKAVGFFTLGTTFMQTHRQLIGGDELFMTRLKTMKTMLMARVAGKEEAWSPWKWCTCPNCKIHKLKFSCHRLDFNTVDNEESLERGESPLIKPGHPDYLSAKGVETMIQDSAYWADIVDSHRDFLEREEERQEQTGPEWVSTYLLCLRVIFNTENADAQLLRWRLDAYMKLISEKSVS